MDNGNMIRSFLLRIVLNIIKLHSFKAFTCAQVHTSACSI
jgi:hypothetical protein